MSRTIRVACFLPMSPAGAEKLRAIEGVELREVSENTRRWAWTYLGQESDENAARAEVDEILAQDEVWFGFGLGRLPFPEADAPLRWIHVAGAGVDWLRENKPPSHIAVTNSRGLIATPIAEWVLTFMLMDLKRMPDAIEYQRAHRWQRYGGHSPRDMTVGVIGLGSIGSEVARLSHAVGARVVATRRSAKPGDSAEHVEELLGPDRLPQVLAQSDYVVLAAPLTDETERMMGASEFSSMKPGAALINVGRGKLVDWEAMLAALESGQLSAVYTDVTDPEPPPEDSAIWETPNLFITAHNSGNRPDYMEIATELFAGYLSDYVAGRPLQNLVDAERAY